jgi:hypothetical protein
MIVVSLVQNYEYFIKYHNIILTNIDIILIFLYL